MLEELMGLRLLEQKTSKIFLLTPPFAINTPDSTNIGTARSGKESIPPNIERMTYSADTVKFGFKIVGAKDTIVKVAEIGTDNNKRRINNRKTTAANILFSLPWILIYDFLMFHQVCNILHLIDDLLERTKCS